MMLIIQNQNFQNLKLEKKKERHVFTKYNSIPEKPYDLTKYFLFADRMSEDTDATG
jgi:hypothetical protein